MTSKVLDTECNHKCVEKQNAYLSSWLLKKVLSLKQRAKDIISGFFLGTGDLLNLVIGIKILTLKVWVYAYNFIKAVERYYFAFPFFYCLGPKANSSKGDGVIVVQTYFGLEGSQETVFNQNRAGRSKTLHSILLRAKRPGNNPVNIHFNKPLGIRYKSTLVSKDSIIKPWFLTGFTDAEGSFLVNIKKSPTLKLRWRVLPVIHNGLQSKDVNTLKEVKAFFGGQGSIIKAKNVVFYRSTTIQELKKVINHFEKYPLQTKKRADFELFKAIVMIIESKKHLIPEGFQEILNHKAYLNNGLPAAIIEAFEANNPNQPFPLLRANLKPVPRLPSIINPQIPDPQWLAGFTDGEGCFSISVAKNSATETGYIVSLRFQISQHLRDENLLRSFINYFGCGRFYPLDGTQKRGDFTVTKLTDNLNIIIPFFLKNPLLGIKAYDFKLWCEAADIMTKKEHLASEGLNKILILKALINKKSTNGGK
uniref:LAGLIDADG endonuclease n=1 Tax=Agaricus bitorquis TaxID=5343 RepID=UPI0027A0DE94|nr:LAGLIDADG endonuclease [Agaricus bitorquis]WFG54021.1 LAGLIDADG endonuclease [Agaricus bitorquis]